jgi:hypothetical protein
MPDSRIHLPHIVGIADQFDAYRALNTGELRLASGPEPQQITFAEASKLGLKPGEVRQEKD